MIIFEALSLGFASFAFGFIFGALRRYKSNSNKKIAPTVSEELERLRNEYHNFLNYDGTEQSTVERK